MQRSTTLLHFWGSNFDATKQFCWSTNKLRENQTSSQVVYALSKKNIKMGQKQFGIFTLYLMNICIYDTTICYFYKKKRNIIIKMKVICVFVNYLKSYCVFSIYVLHEGDMPFPLLLKQKRENFYGVHQKGNHLHTSASK